MHMVKAKRLAKAVFPIGAVVFVLVLQLAAVAPAAAEAQIDVESALKERALGDPAAPVTMIEYASLTCPHCAKFHNETFKPFKQRYIDTGKVRWVYRDFPLDGIALRAAVMARCAAEQRYFGLLLLLYRSQADWARAADPLAELAKIGVFAGIDQTTFDACMASDPIIDGVLALRQQGAAAGVNSTPTFIINDKVYTGEHSIEELAAILDPLLTAK